MAHAARGRLQMQHLNWRCCIMAASQLMHVACDAFWGQSWKWSGMRERLDCAGGTGRGRRSEKESLWTAWAFVVRAIRVRAFECGEWRGRPSQRLDSPRSFPALCGKALCAVPPPCTAAPFVTSEVYNSLSLGRSPNLPYFVAKL